MRLRPVAALGALGLGLGLALAGCGRDPHAGMPEHVRRRHVPLEGASNFRDLGGYASEDGRNVRWGLFYRADSLGQLTDDDLATLSRLGIKLVCDFRSAEEKAEEPDRLPAETPPTLAELPIADESFSPAAFREKITSGELGDLDLRQLLIEGNRLFATRFAPQYAAMLERLSRPENLPAVVHCTAGKDRTGFASAVLLRALGVPLDTVYEDFLLSNHYSAGEIERTLWIIRLVSLFRTDPERVRPLLGVERAYLEAAFAEIDAKYGSFDAYRRDALGLDDAETEAFRRLALE
jgi:protein-tyrosine phosphatase